MHDDAEAERATAAVGARAYAIGEHLVFGAGAYGPATETGRRLIAHEVAHVVQQATGSHSRDDATAHAAAERAASPSTQQGAAPARLRALPAIASPVLQRYPVPGGLACHEIVDWLASNSPYRPEWAETACTISTNGSVNTSYSTQPDGTVRLRARGHRGITADVDCPVDRPEWDPTPRANRAGEVAAFARMRRSLDAHERQHQATGRTWRSTIERRYRAIDFTVSGSNVADAQTQATVGVQEREATWRQEAQSAQSAIDPFSGAVLDCPQGTTP